MPVSSLTALGRSQLYLKIAPCVRKNDGLCIAYTYSSREYQEHRTSSNRQTGPSHPWLAGAMTRSKDMRGGEISFLVTQRLKPEPLNLIIDSLIRELKAGQCACILRRYAVFYDEVSDKEVPTNSSVADFTRGDRHW